MSLPVRPPVPGPAAWVGYRCSECGFPFNLLAAGGVYLDLDAAFAGLRAHQLATGHAYFSGVYE